MKFSISSSKPHCRNSEELCGTWILCSYYVSTKFSGYAVATRTRHSQLSSVSRVNRRSFVERSLGPLCRRYTYIRLCAHKTRRDTEIRKPQQWTQNSYRWLTNSKIRSVILVSLFSFGCNSRMDAHEY